MAQPVSGFYKKSKNDKINWLNENYLSAHPQASTTLKQYWNTNSELQQLHDDFIENTLTNYYLPFGIAPNFKINDALFAIPMVTEESSVVAAASNAAKFWLDRGGFSAEVISTVKNGQVHIDYFGNIESLTTFFNLIKPALIDGIEDIQKNMRKRGGGLLDIRLVNSTNELEGYYQLHCTFETGDAMGANFINTCLESFANTFTNKAQTNEAFIKEQKFPKVNMSILSNFVPECIVRASVQCPVEKLSHKDVKGETFANQFVRAVNIAKTETRRAVTHNKGIMNGVDAVILATGNDFRAVEAGVHAYAAKEGKYTSLTDAKIEDDIFYFWIELPLALGTVGGLTSLHPMSKVALQILQEPTARELMQVVAVAGLAQNFAALRSLTTVGIQKGHMKMHLMNILNQVNATPSQKDLAITHFKDKDISHNAVAEFVLNNK